MTTGDDRGLLEVFLDEARALLRRLATDRDPAVASELIELGGVIGDTALVELARELRSNLEQGHDASLIVDLLAQKLLDLAAPPPPPSSWDPADLAEMRSHFLAEARIHLAAIEESIADLRADPTAKAPYDALFRKLHTLKGSAGSVDLHALSAIAHRLEDLLSAARNRRNAALVTAIAANLPELRRLVGVEPRGAEVPPGFRDRRAAPPAAALRMDELLDTTSELVLDRTRIERRLRSIDEVSAGASPELRAQLAELGADVATLARTSRRLGERVRRLRAIELSSLAERLEVVARSVARREHKQVRVLLRGGTEEIDQRLAEALTEPLLHLVRNAVTHGIEPPEQRIARGKQAVATLTVSLRQTGDGLELSVADDGTGVDVQLVREALVQAERLTPEQAAALPVAAVLATLFQPGISTRAQADDLAGRGVGLDVVADAIARLGGDVSVESTVGAGSVFTIRVPVESRVMEALLFKVGDQLFAVPSARVEEIADVHKDEIQRDARDRVRISGELLPLLRLGALLALPPPPGVGDRRTAIVLHARERRFAITCDRVVGPREIVVRRLPPSLTGLSPWAGATISGAGKVQLIFDVDTLAALEVSTDMVSRPLQPEGPRRVLVVDEARSIRDAVALVLEHAGFSTERAPDGWEALERLADRPFDLVVCRMEQTGLPGPKLVSRIRSSQHLKAVPVVLLTSLDDEQSRAGLVAEPGARVEAIVHLPLRRRPLLDAIAQLLPPT